MVIPAAPESSIDLRAVTVRPTRGGRGHRLRDRLVEEHHYLRFYGIVGKGLRHVAPHGGTWPAPGGWQPGAPRLAARDRWTGWSPERRFSRLHLVRDNSRFVILTPRRVPDPASRVPGPVLRRLSACLGEVPGFRKARGKRCPLRTVPTLAVAARPAVCRGASRQTEDGRRMTVAAGGHGTDPVPRQAGVEDRSDGIPAVRALSGSLDVTGRVVTVDAMHARHQTARSLHGRRQAIRAGRGRGVPRTGGRSRGVTLCLTSPGPERAGPEDLPGRCATTGPSGTACTTYATSPVTGTGAGRTSATSRATSPA